MELFTALMQMYNDGKLVFVYCLNIHKIVTNTTPFVFDYCLNIREDAKTKVQSVIKPTKLQFWRFCPDLMPCSVLLTM